jgi:hypothetical protein
VTNWESAAWAALIGRVLPVVNAEGVALAQVSRESIQASLDELL